MRQRGLAAALVVGAFASLGLVALVTQGPSSTGGRRVAVEAPAVAPARGDAASLLTGPDAVPALEVVEDVQVVRSPAGVVVPVLGRDAAGWRVSTPCGREAVLPTATPVSRVAVVLDPGHGGYDTGAVGPNGLVESELNLAVSRHAAAALERAGFPTVLTRSAEHGMNLANRARLAVALQAKAFVSVHHNAGAWGRSDKPGSETYHQAQSEDSKRLAGLVYEEIVNALSAYPVSWVTVEGAGATWRTRANGEDYFAMVRQPKGVPATLAELAYISNPAEAALLADPAVQRVEGEAVARGIIRFLTTTDSGSGYVPGGRMPPRPRTGRGGDDLCDDPPL